MKTYKTHFISVLSLFYFFFFAFSLFFFISFVCLSLCVPTIYSLHHFLETFDRFIFITFKPKCRLCSQFLSHSLLFQSNKKTKQKTKKKNRKNYQMNLKKKFLLWFLLIIIILSKKKNSQYFPSFYLLVKYYLSSSGIAWDIDGIQNVDRTSNVNS